MNMTRTGGANLSPGPGRPLLPSRGKNQNIQSLMNLVGQEMGRVAVLVIAAAREENTVLTKRTLRRNLFLKPTITRFFTRSTMGLSRVSKTLVYSSICAESRAESTVWSMCLPCKRALVSIIRVTFCLEDKK